MWWGPQDESEAVRAIHAALDAPTRRRPRLDEMRDDAARENGDDFMDLRPAAIRADVESSLRRLDVERLDLLEIHDRDPSVPIEETWRTVLELVTAGKVRHGGISNHRAEEVERALAVGPVAGLQCGGGRTAAQGALAFVLSHPAVTGAIVGVRNEREAAELAPAARLRLTPDEVAAVSASAPE